MNYRDLEILTKIRHLDSEDKGEVLQHIENLSEEKQRTVSRRRAMQQIREALNRNLSLPRAL